MTPPTLPHPTSRPDVIRGVKLGIDYLVSRDQYEFLVADAEARKITLLQLLTDIVGGAIIEHIHQIVQSKADQVRSASAQPRERKRPGPKPGSHHQTAEQPAVVVAAEHPAKVAVPNQKTKKKAPDKKSAAKAKSKTSSKLD